MKISEQGPQGPVSPICQKLSEVAMRMILASGKPAILRHSSAASSSVWKTVTRSLSFGRPNSLVIRFQASSIASGLK